MKSQHNHSPHIPTFLMIPFLLLVLVILFLPVTESQAASLTVNTSADNSIAGDGFCSLREAINNANMDSETTSGDCLAGAAGDTINFDPGLRGNTITLTLGQLPLTSTITINGLGPSFLAISGNNASRVFTVTGDIIINDLTIKEGQELQFGGGIHNTGDLTLNNCVVRDNSTTTFASAMGYGGGGIYQGGTLTLNQTAVISNTSGHHGGGILEVDAITTTIKSSLIARNVAETSNDKGAGGGLFRWSGNGDLNIINSTISGNTSKHAGAGICFGFGSGGGAGSEGTLNLINSTVTNNTSAKRNSGGLGNYSDGNATFYFQNSIVAGNTGISGDGNCESWSGFVSLGYNLESGTSCGFTGTGDQQGVNPQLIALTDNGGATETHALQTGSPAIDQIPVGTNGCALTNKDQRDAFRANGTAPANRCDIGAYEVGDTFAVDVTGPGWYYLHKADIEVTTRGFLSEFSTVYTYGDHPNRTGTQSGSGVGWGEYWTHTATGSGYNLNMTLPHAFPLDHINTEVCKYPGGLGGAGWDCAYTGSTTTAVTRNGITELSDWAVGYSVSPTAVSIREFGVHKGYWDAILGVLVLFVVGSSLHFLRRRIPSLQRESDSDLIH